MTQEGQSARKKEIDDRLADMTVEDANREERTIEKFNVWTEAAWKYRSQKVIGRFNKDQQIVHLHSEVSETLRAIEKSESEERIISEIGNVIQDALTLAKGLGYTTSDLVFALNDNTKTLRERISHFYCPDCGFNTPYGYGPPCRKCGCPYLRIEPPLSVKESDLTD